MATKKSTPKTATTEATRGGAARGSTSVKKTVTAKTSNSEALRGGASRGNKPGAARNRARKEDHLQQMAASRVEREAVQPYRRGRAATNISGKKR